MRFNMIDWMLRPGAAAAAMGIVVWLLQHHLPVNRGMTIVEVMVGVLVYFAAAILLKVLSFADIKKMLSRKGGKP
jgi:hypothetical protein